MMQDHNIYRQKYFTLFKENTEWKHVHKKTRGLNTEPWGTPKLTLRKLLSMIHTTLIYIARCSIGFVCRFTVFFPLLDYTDFFFDNTLIYKIKLRPVAVALYCAKLTSNHF